MDCSWVKEHLEAYALGALDPENHGTVERHLAGCANCRRLIDELATAANLLPLGLAAVSPLQPPTDLKSRVLHAVQASTVISSPTVAEAPDDSTPFERLPAQPTAIKDSASLSVAVSIRPDWWRARTLAAIAAALILALTLAWTVRLSEALDRERALRDRIEDHFSHEQEIVLEVVDSDQTIRVVLRPVAADSRAYGKLFTRPDQPYVVAMAARLPIPTEGQTYHLWLTSEGHTFLAGVLPVNDQGFGLLTFDAERIGPTYDAAVLTLQSPGDSVPAGETVLAWDGTDS